MRLRSCWFVLCVGLMPLSCVQVDSSDPTEPVLNTGPLDFVAHGDPADARPNPQPLEAVKIAAPEAVGDEKLLTAYTSPGDLPHLELIGGAEKLPLRHTDVKATITGFVAEVEVRQTYRNAHEAPIEAVYVFPLPENSAVNHMKMVIGDREVVGRIEKRKKAKAIYDQAKAAGHTAALLEQERPNIFTQSVANIAPGEDIDVVVRYVQDLTYDRGTYEFVFPMVVGPRFHQGDPVDQPRSGLGTHPDTDMVADASRISPPVAGPGTRTGHDISLSVEVDAGFPVVKQEVPTHDVVAQTSKTGHLSVALAQAKEIPNRDFVLRYAVAQKKVASTMLLQPRQGKGKGKGQGKGGHFSLVVQPPNLDVDALVGKRELIFVVDVSGSMTGVPLAMTQTAMRDALRKLRPVDTFNIISFSGSTGSAFARPRPANTHNLREAMGFVNDMVAGGGTYMQDAVYKALSSQVGAGRHRYVFFMTDGFVSIEQQVFDLVESLVSRLAEKGQRARVFGFGVGSSPNRELIEGLSSAGKGVSVYATNREDPARAVNLFYHRIDHPVLTDLRFEWGGGKVDAVHPDPTPDLFASRPFILHGRYDKAPTGKVVIRAKANGKTVKIPVQVRQTQRSALPTLWARAEIEDLERRAWNGADPDLTERIERVALDHQLVTKYTSFVAVDRTRIVGESRDTIVQPVDGPEDVDVEMAGGHAVYDFEDDSVDGDMVLSPSGSQIHSRARSHHKTLLDMDSQEGPLGGAYSAPVRELVEPEPEPVSEAPPRRRTSLDTKFKNESKKRKRKKKKKKSAGGLGASPPEGQRAKAQVTVGAVANAGNRSAASLRTEIRKHLVPLRRCFERSVPSSDLTTRQLLVTVELNGAGSVVSVSVSSGTLGSAGNGCIKAEVKRWKFGADEQSGTLKFAIPLTLRWS